MFEDDEIIHEFCGHWVIQCKKCGCYFTMKAGGERKNYCLCSPLMKKQSEDSNQTVYILMNHENLMKIGLAAKRSLKQRIKNLNRKCESFGYKPFELVQVIEMAGRNLAYSLERFLHHNIKHLRIKPLPPYNFCGEGEIYPTSVLHDVNRLVNLFIEEVEPIIPETNPFLIKVLSR